MKLRCKVKLRSIQKQSHHNKLKCPNNRGRRTEVPDLMEFNRHSSHQLSVERCQSSKATVYDDLSVMASFAGRLLIFVL